MRKFFPIGGGRSLVIYDFAPDLSEFPYISGKFYFLFYQCRDEGEMGGGGRICSVSSFDNVVSSLHENLLKFSLQS